jgi:hypothetical protein
MVESALDRNLSSVSATVVELQIQQATYPNTLCSRRLPVIWRGLMMLIKRIDNARTKNKRFRIKLKMSSGDSAITSLFSVAMVLLYRS